MWITIISVLMAVGGFLLHLLVKSDPKSKPLCKVLGMVSVAGICGTVMGLILLGLSSPWGWIAFILLLSGVGWYIMHRNKDRGVDLGKPIDKIKGLFKPNLDKSDTQPDIK